MKVFHCGIERIHLKVITKISRHTIRVITKQTRHTYKRTPTSTHTERELTLEQVEYDYSRRARVYGLTHSNNAILFQ